MSTDFYPRIEVFWNATRARNFVKALGFKPGKYADNMKILADYAHVHVKQMGRVNPLTYAERQGIGRKYADKILGKQVVAELEQERTFNCWGAGSMTWAYHKKQPIPAYREPVVAPPPPPVNTPPRTPPPEAFDWSRHQPVRPPLPKSEWSSERKKMHEILEELKMYTTPSGDAYINSLSKLFNFIILDIAFFMKYPTLHNIAVKKVQDGLANKQLESMTRLLMSARYMLEKTPPVGSQCVLTSPRVRRGYSCYGEPLAVIGVVTNIFENKTALVSVGGIEYIHSIYDMQTYTPPPAPPADPLNTAFWDDQEFCSQCGDDGCYFCEGYDSCS
jgi:hypothetical protein